MSTNRELSLSLSDCLTVSPQTRLFYLTEDVCGGGGGAKCGREK